METKQISLSVRTLVEFILRSGDINSSGVGVRDTEAMLKGGKIHRKIQRSMGPEYQAEVSLSYEIPMEREGLSFVIMLDGRADGIIKTKELVTIDEIKGVYQDVNLIEEPYLVHKAQAMCYGFIYGTQNGLTEVEIQMTYCNLETEVIKRFQERFSMEYLTEWFDNLINEYGKWAAWQIKWEIERNKSIRGKEFPFAYRNGQRDLVVGVYKTILRNKKLYVEAPTGVGKTISTVYPATMAMGEGIVEKIFYLTAKTITRTVAEEAFHTLRESGMNLKVITLTAKEKICVLDRPECNPGMCERAKGHFDRINDAVYDMLVSEHEISRELIEQYSRKHMVCPHEMALDITLWADAVICDYNYAFDPKVYLKRFFQSEKKNKYCFLVDEAHNLVDRAREMYSATLVKEDFLSVKNIIKSRSKKMEKRLSAANRQLLILKKNWEEAKDISEKNTKYQLLPSVDALVLTIMNLLGEYDEFLKQFPEFPDREKVLELYFQLYHFMNMYELLNDKYEIYVNEDEEHQFYVRLQCMDPSDNLKLCLEKGSSAVFFSATFLPIQYYKEQLAGTADDYAIYAPSPFDPKKRLILVANDVSTKYTRRNAVEYEKVVRYIYNFMSHRLGNYLVFFPSYRYMELIYEMIQEEHWANRFKDCEIILQKSRMTEVEKEEFLNEFEMTPERSKVGFCVMGGIFSEGIDLKHDRLIGTIIVGTGLPMVGDERELFREYYDGRTNNGFDYAYLYNGMNKVLQSAGRVIRTTEDIGAILLLDDRFTNRQYTDLFPKEWFPFEIVNENTVNEKVERFWRRFREDD